MEDDDDDVVQEVPVFSSRNLNDKLYLFLYPNVLASLNPALNPIVSSSVKLTNREVKLELALDTQSNNYDYDKGERIGTEANGVPSTDPKKPNEKFFRRNIMDRLKLESRQAIPDVSNYMVGLLHNKELHLTPLKAIVHLRKSIFYLDQADKQAKAVAKEQGLGTDELSGDEDEEEVKQVTVKFARQENERYKLAKERSFSTLIQKIAEEPWLHTEYHEAGTSLSKAERQRLLCKKREPALLDEAMSSEADVSWKLGLLGLAQSVEPTHSDELQSVEDLKRLPVADRVRNFIKEAKVVRFGHLLSLLNLESDAANALKVVQQMGVLVQGNWVVRSELLYKKEKAGPAQISPELLCRGRDYVLYLFTQQQIVDRLKVSEMVKISPENVRDMLVQFARYRRPDGWELLLPPDAEFATKYPEVAQRQQLQWDIKQRQLRDAFKECRPSPTKPRRKSNRDSSVSDNDAGAEGLPRRKHRRKSTSVVLSSDNESGPEGRGNGSKGGGARRKILAGSEKDS